MISRRFPGADIPHHAPRLNDGQLADWLEDAAFLFMLFPGASRVVAILMLLIVL